MIFKSSTLPFVFLAFATVAAVLVCSPASAITLGQIDDFQDGTTQAWASGGANPNPPINLSGAGQGGAGDHVLQISTSGASGGAGSKLIGFNEAQWIGDYLASGVNKISMDLSSPNNVPLNVRLVLQGPGGNFVTPDAIVPAGTGVWNNYLFSLAPGDLLPADGTDVNQTLGGVTKLRLLHNPVASVAGAVVPGGGSVFAASLLADNITAVPEPATWMLLTFGALMMPLRRRRS